MTPSDKCTSLIKRSEGLRLQAYLCPAGRLTIGFGHTGPDVRPGQVISEQRAAELLALDTSAAFGSVLSLTAHGTAPLTQGQCDALTDFVFNHGKEALKTSHLLLHHNAGEYQLAAAEFIKWDHAHVNGKLVEMPGLKARAEAQTALYLS
jgi:lysozyme